MADSKLSDLTADASPTSDDLIYVVNDPAGTPADRKVTLANLATALAAMAGLTGAYVAKTGGTFTGDINVPDETYDATSWNGSTEVPTKNAIRDKIETLGSGTTSTYANVVGTSQTTTSTSYTDLTTSGPAVTVDVPAGGSVLCIITVDISNSNQTTTRVGIDLSGANTVAAADTAALRYEEAANLVNSQTSFIPMTGLTPGTTTFTLKYKVAGGTGTFANRKLTVFTPLV